MTRIGIVGVGSISGIYLENITNKFQNIEIIGVCDLIRERAERAVEKYNIPKLYETMHDMFADPDVDLVLNIVNTVSRLRPKHLNIFPNLQPFGRIIFTDYNFNF